SINIAKDRMVFAGCNLMVLSVFNLKGKFKPLNILLPPVIVNTIGALNMQGDCKISYSENSICFEYSNLIVKSLLFDEKYRDYMGIVPKDSPVKAMVSRVELLGSLKRVLEFSNKEKRINIESVNGILNIIGEDTAYKQRASESIGISGGNIDIGLNGAFLAESLTRLSSESVEIAYTAFDKPILITEPGESENFIMIMAALKI
ncbi:MAG TPA: DNA polymerase III subunit beta, partial [Bacteroidia bacterium]|nr:DNA polymerase III subunit beta [Bacteroidia bacterium]